jgi:hypothetical protein
VSHEQSRASIHPVPFTTADPLLPQRATRTTWSPSFGRQRCVFLPAMRIVSFCIEGTGG